MNGTKVIQHSKFTQNNNYELFVITPDDIYIRYETAPEIYGGQQNAIRRFAGRYFSNSFPGTEKVPAGNDNGAFWMKRLVRASDAGRVLLNAYAIDNTNLKTNQLNLDGSSVSGNPQFHWFEFTTLQGNIPYYDPSQPIMRNANFTIVESLYIRAI